MKKLALLCCCLALLAQENKKPPNTIKQPAVVVAQFIQNGNLSSNLKYIGSLYFSQHSKLASEVSGVIEKIFVKEGDKIKKGQALARLNSDLLNQEINSKQASLKQARALYKKTLKDFERYKNLYKSQSIAYKEYEDALFNLQAQEGNTEAISANLARLQTEADKKTILAPYDGIVLKQFLQQGEWVSAGASIFHIAKLSGLEASIEVPFEVLRLLKVGQSIQTEIANQSYQATISAIIPLGNSRSRTFPIKLAINDPKGELIEGLEVRANLNISKLNDTLLIPRDSILPTQEGHVIFIINQNKAKKIPIIIQGYEGAYASIKPIGMSLSPNDKVIIEGNERLLDGQEIKEL